MIKKLFWVGIGATAGWLSHQKFQEKKNEVNQRVQEEGIAIPGLVAKDTANFLLNQARHLLASRPTDTHKPYN